MTQMVVGEKKGTCGSGSLVYVVGSLAKACNWACSLAMHNNISENQIVNCTRQTRQAPVKNDWFTVAANQHWSCFQILLSEHLARIPRCHVPQRWRSLGDPVDRSLCHFISHLIKLLQKSVSKSGDPSTALTNLDGVFYCTPCPLHWGCIRWQCSFHLRIRSLSHFIDDDRAHCDDDRYLSQIFLNSLHHLHRLGFHHFTGTRCRLKTSFQKYILPGCELQQVQSSFQNHSPFTRMATDKKQNINTSVGASDYWTLSAQSANLERFASNSFCPLKFCFTLEDRPKGHFRNCNAQNTSPVQLDWQHYWAPAQGGEAEKAGWSSPPFPRSPTRLRRQLLPEVQQWNYPGACLMGGATTFPSSTCPCPVSWFSVSVCPPAAGCSTTGSSEPAASAILSAEWLWNRIQSVIKGTAQEELSWRGMAF